MYECDSMNKKFLNVTVKSFLYVVGTGKGVCLEHFTSQIYSVVCSSFVKTPLYHKKCTLFPPHYDLFWCLLTLHFAQYYARSLIFAFSTLAKQLKKYIWKNARRVSFVLLQVLLHCFLYIPRIFFIHAIEIIESKIENNRDLLSLPVDHIWVANFINKLHHLHRP